MSAYEDAFTAAFRVGKTIGSGGFATVKMCRRREDRSVWAVKCAKRKNLRTEDEYVENAGGARARGRGEGE